MNFWECIIDASNETESGVPSTTSVPTIAEYIRWGNKAQDIIANMTNCIEKCISFAGVASQEFYTPGTEFLRPVRVEYVKSSNTIYELQWLDMDAYRAKVPFNFSTGTPQYYSIWDRKIYIWPYASASADATTATGVNAANAATINCASTTGFANHGRFALVVGSNTEEIEYTGITSTSFTGCTRGINGSTAVATTGNEVITKRDILVWANTRYKVRPLNIYTTGTATATLSSATVAAGSTAPLWSGNVYANMEFGVTTNPTKWYDITAVSATPTLTLSVVYAETTATNSTYVISSKLDMPQEYSDLLTKYMIHRTWKRLEETDKAEQAKQEFYEMMGELRKDVIIPGNEYPVFHDVNMYDW